MSPEKLYRKLAVALGQDDRRRGYALTHREPHEIDSYFDEARTLRSQRLRLIEMMPDKQAKFDSDFAAELSKLTQRCLADLGLDEQTP